MAEESEPVVDLLGEPWTDAPDPRGRKRHRRIAQVAETVALLRAAGHSETQIALRTNLDPKTLRKYYSREIHEGAHLAKAVVIERLMKQSKAGNVAASKALLIEFSKGDAVVPPPRDIPPKEEPIGKKAQADLAAQTAHESSDWGQLLKPH